MNVGKKFLIILLIIFLVSITGVSAIEAPANDTGVDDASISGELMMSVWKFRLATKVIFHL